MHDQEMTGTAKNQVNYLVTCLKYATAETVGFPKQHGMTIDMTLRWKLYQDSKDLRLQLKETKGLDIKQRS